ncbi:unnamed protein product [marine sediment metagenome]|uniref:Uncharacterized protein n=1 Tax=marine sediment metagenome TaxID=412755 RepID=X0YVU9_9ZZZZ
MSQKIVRGLAEATVRGRGCTGAFEQAVEELIKEWKEEYGGKEESDDEETE